MPTGDDLLIEEAIRQRQWRRSGKFLAGALTLAVFFAAVGYMLAFHSGVITYSMPYPSGFPLEAVLVGTGMIAFLVAAVFLAGAVSGARPRAPWADAVTGECPACGEQALRQEGIVVREGRTLKTAVSGAVTLCETPGCPYAAVS